MTRREDGTDAPLRVLQVGCGSISRLWLDPLRGSGDATVVGFVDLDAATAREAARTYGDEAPAGTDLQAMLALTRPDVVFDCTVPEAHHDVTLAALEAGCHVFGEKPMAGTWAQAQAMIAAATRHVLLRDMAIHTFDAARFLTREEPEAVTCTSWNPPGSWFAHGASAVAVFEVTGGVVFTYRGSWCSEGLATPWEGHWRIVGTRGSVIWDGCEDLRCEIVAEPGGLLSEHERLPTPSLARTDTRLWHATAIEAFLRAIRAGVAPETVCSDNVRSLAMVFAACDSADAQRRVVVSAGEGRAGRRVHDGGRDPIS